MAAPTQIGDKVRSKYRFESLGSHFLSHSADGFESEVPELKSWVPASNSVKPCGSSGIDDDRGGPGAVAT